MIAFNCPSCNLQIKVPDQAAGRTGTCPRCHVKVRAPDQELSAAPLQGVRAGGAPAAPAPMTQVTCPSCGEMISAQAKKCRFCGEELAPAQIPCPSCGEMIAAKAKKCRFCGELLECSNADSPRQTPPPRYDDYEDDYEPHHQGRDTGRYSSTRDFERNRPANRGAPRRLEKPELEKRLGDYFRGFFSKYADFSGRATRREFWMVALSQFIFDLSFWIVFAIVFAGIYFIALKVDDTHLSDEVFEMVFWPMRLIAGILHGIFMLAIACPWMALSCRRAHDVGCSGAVGVLLWLLCGIGHFILGLIPGNEGPNQYGPDPYCPDAEEYDDDYYDDGRPGSSRRR